MRLLEDERGQAIQVGFILIFGVLVVSFASYQAFVVPDQNSEVEFNHNQQVQGQLQELRSAIVSSAGRTAGSSVTVDLGTTYPSRVAAANPPPPSGALRTVGTTDSGINLSITNAVAQDSESADYWDGGERAFSTGLLEYSPEYNEYRNAPRTVYDNTLLYNQFSDANRSLTGQTMVDGNELTLVVLNGSLQAAQSGSYSVDVQPVSTPAGSTTVTNASGEELSVSFPSRFPPAMWNETLASEYDGATDDSSRKYVTGVGGSARPDGLYSIRVTFEDDDYQLRMMKVGVGSGVADEPAAYLTVADDGKASVNAGDSTELTLSVRDTFANAVGNVSVNVSAPDGQFEGSGTTSARQFTGADGQVSFVYQATGTTGAKQLEFGLGAVGTGFDGSTPENATVSVSVTGDGGNSGGAYGVNWLTDDFTFDFAGSTREFATNASITAEGLNFDYAVSNTSVVTVKPDEGVTNSSGENQTTVTANNTGTTAVYVVSGGSSDVVNITVAAEDTQRPTVVTFSGVSVDKDTNNASIGDLEVEDSASGLSSVNVTVRDSGGTLIGSQNATGLDASATVSRTDLIVETDGIQPNNDYTVTVVAKDAAGNRELQSKTVTSSP